MGEVRKGYVIAAFNFTDMLEVDDSMNIFEDDEQTVEAAVADGIRIIPVDELPENFDRRYYGWIDTPENRRAIQRYCDQYLS
jgi:hypothetical protein